MRTLCYALGACSLAPHIALEWIGGPYEAVRVQSGSWEFLSIKSTGAAPILRKDDGRLLTQAGATLNHLASAHPEAGLAGGEGMRARAEAQRWPSFFAAVIDAYSFPLIRWAMKLIPGGLTAYSDVQMLHDRIGAGQAVQKVLAREAGE